MARLIYSAITSLDGYVADEHGKFDWSAPDEEVHAFVNELERPIGTYLYGRRLYEVMAVWEKLGNNPALPAVAREYAKVWKAANKIVYSKTLREASTARTRVDRDLNTEAIKQMKVLADKDISVGGSELAAQAIKAGLVDECRLFLTPIVVGGGRRALPEGVRVKFELMAERRFRNGVVYLQYRART